jgi:hypothetical protein
MKFLRDEGGNMDSAFQYMHAVQQSAGAWVEELFQRASHPLESGKERRFVWPLAEVAAPHEELNKKASLAVRISTATWRAHMLFDQALRNYTGDFNNLYDKTAQVINRNALFEQHKMMEFDPSFVHAFMEMHKILTKMIGGATEESTAYFTEKSGQLFAAVLSGNFEAIARFWERQVEILDIVVHQNPAAMEAIRSEMGCRFDDEERYIKITETSRAVLYQVLPIKKRVAVRKNGKPVIHKAPFILPESIIDLLPYEGLSYVGAFANSGTPTYFMHGKNIWDTAEAQVLSEEHLLLDLKLFAEKVHGIHGLKATINGTCQGALPLLHGICSPQLQLDRDVDVWIGTVPAYGLSRSKRFEDNLRMIPKSKRHLGAITHRLPSGNDVVLGEPASLSMRLSNFGKENPVSSLIRDMRGAERGKLSPMAAALRQYLQTINPMPLKITEMSQRCTTTPITREGVFPELLFEEPISLRYAIERGIKLYVVAGEKDEVVDLPSALAMFEIPCINNYSGASCYVIPGAGHVAPMTTCAVKGSKNFIGNVGGPLWYHLKIEAEEMRQKTL